MSVIVGQYPGITKDGLVLHLDASKSNSYPGSGDTWYDLSGNQNNGTLVNNPTFSSDVGGSIVFDGTNYVDTIDVSSYADLTIEMWLYDTRTFSSITSQDILTYNGNSGSYSYGQLADFRTDGDGMYARNFGGGDGSYVSYPSNSWYRFCYVKNGDLWINNNQYFGYGLDRSYGLLSFANTRSNVSNRLTGRISNIRVYNRSLSSSEILNNYNCKKRRFGL